MPHRWDTEAQRGYYLVQTHPAEPIMEPSLSPFKSSLINIVATLRNWTPKELAPSSDWLSTITQATETAGEMNPNGEMREVQPDLQDWKPSVNRRGSCHNWVGIQFLVSFSRRTKEAIAGVMGEDPVDITVLQGSNFGFIREHQGPWTDFWLPANSPAEDSASGPPPLPRARQDKLGVSQEQQEADALPGPRDELEMSAQDWHQLKLE